MQIKILKFIAFALPVLFMACDDLERDNPLDPKNPASIRTETVLVESFVNQSGGACINSSLAAFEKLLRDYGDDSFVYLEHHIENTPGTDNNAVITSLNRYKILVPETGEQAIPDVFFNGLQGRVQGASDMDAAYLRYSQELEKELGRQTYFTIEATARVNSPKITVSAQIARLGSEDVKDIVLYAVVLSRVPGSIRSIVKAFITVDAFDEIENGEVKSVKRDIDIQSNWDIDDLEVIVFIQNSRDLYVYQTVKAEIN